MENKIVGAIFCFMSAVLISARYISAAIFMSGVASWDATLFAAGLEYVGPFFSNSGWYCVYYWNPVSGIWAVSGY